MGVSPSQIPLYHREDPLECVNLTFNYNNQVIPKNCSLVTFDDS